MVGPDRRQPGSRTKKLIAWARWLAGAGPGLDDEQGRLWDLDREWSDEGMQDYCRACMNTGGCDACPRPRLLPGAYHGAAAYQACDTQWRYSFGGRTGLDYASCMTVIGHALGRWQEKAGEGQAIAHMSAGDLLEQVGIIERALLQVDAEQRDREQQPGGDDTTHGH